ncbi:MAG TPA: response regulator [Gammaproteobacteria bacterium]|nr:response regulator [Gammaproteobacteria bacterium]
MGIKTTNILVVDSSEVSRTIISRILLTEMDYTCITTCSSGEEALRALENDRFDLITTSLMLPDMDGLELTRSVRESAHHHYTPIVVVSGDADGRLLREGFNAGVTDYFDKSLGYQSFVSFIKSFTRRNSGLVGRILYVEDSRTAAMVTRHIMEKHGLNVIHTTTAEAALDFLEQTRRGGPKEDEGVDIVVTDFFLKGQLTGGDLLHAIRARLHYSQQEMPVLVVTVADNEEKQAEVFHAGANDFVTKPIIEEILIARIHSLLLIKQQFYALKRQAEEMKHIASTDSLTGTRSKRYLLDHGETFLKNKKNSPVWAYLIDIDHFKKINDTLGHITGDHVLAALGDLLIKSFGENCILVRFGGEEFAVLIPQCSAREAKARSEVLRRKVEELRPVNVDITISIGMASTMDIPNTNLNDLLQAADKALYAAKKRGRNRICIHSGLGVEHSILPHPNTPIQSKPKSVANQ